MDFLQNSTNSSGVTLALWWLPVLIKRSKKVHYLSAKSAELFHSSPKRTKTLLENLRLISLLNVDYKILTKSIAKRLEKVLPKIINSDQTGYIKGRFIGENVRLIQDVMSHTKQEEKPGIAIFLDFRKAFDTIEWNYLRAALQTFNFGPDILNWFQVIYNQASSCVLHNGQNYSQYFPYPI